jgi:hypothetical protein
MEAPRGRVAAAWAAVLCMGAGALAARAVWKARARGVREAEAIVVTRTALRSPEDRAAPSLFAAHDSLYELDMSARTWADLLSLDASEVARWEHSGPLRYVSLREYFSSIRVAGQIDSRRMAVTLLSELGAEMLLPALGMMGSPLSSRGKTQLDPFLVRVGQYVLEALVSPVTIAAVSMTAHKAAARLVFDKFDPVRAQRHGSDGGPDVARLFEGLPNPFVLERDFQGYVDRLLALWGEAPGSMPPSSSPTQVPAPSPAPLPWQLPRPVNTSYAPGLNWGAPGTAYFESAPTRARAQVLCVLFNRLVANLYWTVTVESPAATPGPAAAVAAATAETHSAVAASLDAAPVPSEVFRVGLDAELVDSADKLVALLMAKPGYKVRVGIHTILTSFGNCLSCEDVDGSVYQVPLCLPMRCGITAVDGSDIIVPMAHAGVCVMVDGPLFGGEIGAEFYQMVSSYSGFHPYYARDWPWHRGAELWHDSTESGLGEREQLELVRGASVMSVLSNVAAQQTSLAMGGYGFLGVCLDSVAVLQLAIGAKCTIFPLLLSGQARAIMLSVAQRMRAALARRRQPGLARPSPEEDTVRNVQLALVQLHSDIDVPPKYVSDTCDRLVASLPPRSLFAIVAKARAQAAELASYMRAEYGRGPAQASLSSAGSLGPGRRIVAEPSSRTLVEE